MLDRALRGPILDDKVAEILINNTKKRERFETSKESSKERKGSN